METPAMNSARDKEREREKEKEREREKELELESALYSNCLLLGLDAAVLSSGNGGARTGLFRHSNPRMGEILLHFILSALRGPAQSAKDFAGVWPIFDSAQSRDFRKIVQGLINELESQGALPRSNSRVSSLATCCGQRFVELLWQLSAHALREVHKRTFTADVASNPMPASLTEVVNQSSHASALLAVTKARIALERRRFLEGAAAAVQRQALWSSLAHDMTAEFRALCAEEAYLHQELEKLQDMKNQKVSLDDDDRDCGEAPPDQKTLSVSRASYLWQCLLTHTAQHEELASGPIEDLIAHREHRYRISGSALRAAIDHSSNASSPDSLFSLTEDLSHRCNLSEEIIRQSGPLQDGSCEKQDMCLRQMEGRGNEESYSKFDERSGKGSTVDVAEILRRWTHALQRIHKQVLRLARSSDGAGPQLLKSAADSEGNGHIEALQATLAEHRNHVANIRALAGQLKDAMPGMEATISMLRQKVNRATSASAMTVGQHMVAGLPLRCQDSDKGNADRIFEGSSKAVPSHLELIPPTPVLKLPQLFSVSPIPLAKYGGLQKHHSTLPQVDNSETLGEFDKVNASSPVGNLRNEELQDNGNFGVSSLRQSVRDVALSKSDTALRPLRESVDNNIDHFFLPLSSTCSFPRSEVDKNSKWKPTNSSVFRSLEDSYKSGRSSALDKRKDHSGKQSKKLPTDQEKSEDCHIKQSMKSSSGQMNYDNLFCNSNHVSNRDPCIDDSKLVINSNIQNNNSLENYAENADGEINEQFSPPLLLELSSFSETYDDLLAPMSEVDAALMDSSVQILHT